MFSSNNKKVEFDKIKILVLTYSFFPYSTVSAFRMLRLVKYLPEYDIKPYVITARHNKIFKRYPDTIYLPTPFSYKFDSPVNPLRYRKRTGFFGSSANYILRMLKDIFLSPDKHILWSLLILPAALITIKKNHIRTVLVTGDPFSLFISGYLLKKLTKIILILDYRDPWLSNPMNRIQTFIRRYYNYFAQKKCLKAADLVVAVNETILEEIKLITDKTLLLPNGFDPEYFDDEETANEKVDENFTFFYAGKFDIDNLSYNPESLLKGYNLFLQQNPTLKTRIVVCGEVSKHTLNKLAQEDLLINLHFEGHISHQEVLKLARKADALIQFYYPIKYHDTVPGKMYDYLILKKPILSVNSKEGILADLLKTTNAGYSCENDDFAGIASMLKKICELNLETFRQELRKDEIAKFDARKQTRVLADKIKEKTRA